MRAMLVITFLCMYAGIVAGEVELPSDVKRLQALRQSKIDEINKAYLRELRKLKAKYEKQGKKEIADAIQIELDRLEKEKTQNSRPEAASPVPDSEPQNKRAEVYCRASFVRFKDHSNTYNDFGGHFADVPDEYKNTKISLCDIKSPDPLVFKVKEPGIVTLVIEPMHRSVLEKEGWTLTGKARRTHGEGEGFVISIYEKYLDTGEYSYTKTKLDETFGIRIVKF